MSDKEIMALKAARAALYKQAETGQRYCTKTGSMYFGEAAGIVEVILIREIEKARPLTESQAGGISDSWRRFELIAPAQEKELFKLLQDKHLSRRDLALVVTTLHVRPGFSLEDFDT